MTKRRLGLGAVAVAAVLIAGVDTSAVGHGKPPAWAQTCFTRWAPPLPGDSQYVGLSVAAAKQRARRNGQLLELVGAGGQCQKYSDDVARIVLANSSPKAGYNGSGLS